MFLLDKNIYMCYNINTDSQKTITQHLRTAASVAGGARPQSGFGQFLRYFPAVFLAVV
jgi:hypothetical protein